MAYDINTIDDLIEEMGGNTALGDWLDITPEAVSNWKRRNAIATGWHLRLDMEMRKRGKSVNPSVFGLEPDAAQQRLAS